MSILDRIPELLTALQALEVLAEQQEVYNMLDGETSDIKPETAAPPPSPVGEPQELQLEKSDDAKIHFKNDVSIIDNSTIKN